MPKSLALLWGVLLASTAAADEYQRQPGIDIVHYDISVELRDTSDAITGKTRVHAMILEEGLDKMWLDLEDMSVDGLTVSGEDQAFDYGAGKLSFGLGRPFHRREIAVIEVRYHGTPRDTGMLIGKNSYGRRVFFAENWPDRAHHWFPSIDHPSDKATVDFDVTAPERYDVVANGRLVETRSLMDGRRLTRWSEAADIPTYCMVIGAAEFSIARAGTVAGVPLTNYSYPQDAAAAAAKFERSDLVIRYFTEAVGPYPYEKLAQVESTTRIGGMENSSAIFYTERGFQRTPVREGPVPHEIAHQWFGDSVTEADWDHLWLSEGFATYFNALFYEHLEGFERLKSIMAGAAEAVKRYHKERPVPIIDPDLDDLMKKLNAFNYQKGAWVLHMLRKKLGDQVFFDGVRRYYSMYEGKSVTSEDFQRVMEAAAGASLETFFHQWLYLPGWPDYRVSWHWDQEAGEVEVTIRQVQTTGLFDMRLDLTFLHGEARDVRSVEVSDESAVFRFPLQAKPAAVELDPDGWVLKSVEVRER